MHRRTSAALALALCLAGCGGNDEPRAVATPPGATAAPAETVPPATATAAPGVAAPAAQIENPYVQAIAVDPGDGTILVGTGPMLYRIAPRARTAEHLTGELTAPEGSGTLSGNVVVRFQGPGDLLGSGHPLEGSLPENLGLIRSGDHGDTWSPLSGLGAADYHDLETASGRIVALEAAESPAAEIKLSRDGGRTFESRTAPAPVTDVTVNPRDPRQWAAATDQGIFTSTNDGESWRSRDPTPGVRLAWAVNGELYSAAPSGQVRVSTDSGRSWKDRGKIGSGPTELVAGPEGDLYAGVPGGKIRRSRDGGARWSTLTTLS